MAPDGARWRGMAGDEGPAAGARLRGAHFLQLLIEQVFPQVDVFAVDGVLVAPAVGAALHLRPSVEILYGSITDRSHRFAAHSSTFKHSSHSCSEMDSHQNR